MSPGLMLWLAAGLCLVLGLVHSLLGEYMLMRHLPGVQGLPLFRGSPDLPRQTIRITWHITSLLAWAITAILARLAALPGLGATEIFILQILALCFFACFLVALIGTRGRHPSWLAFLILALLCLLATRG